MPRECGREAWKDWRVATIRPFRALRPPRDLANRVSAPPYDVVSAVEAKALAVANLDSYLHVSLPETNLDPAATADAEEVHLLGRAALEDFVARGLLVRDEMPSLMVYRQRMGDEVQTGVVGCASVEEYRRGAIATHEHTRPDKETDRTRHIEALGAHDEPVFLVYRSDTPGAETIADVVARVTSSTPEYDFTADDGVVHTVWTVKDTQTIETLATAFDHISILYIADGHHRSAAAARVWDKIGHKDVDDVEAAYFPVVVFPADQLTVLAYNRVVRDIGKHGLASFLKVLAPDFDVRPSRTVPVPGHHQFGLYAKGAWHLLTARDGIVDESDPIGRLDVSLLQDRVLEPIFGIADPRTDKHVAFVGGIRGTDELVRLVDSGEYAAAFTLYPTSPEEVMDVADRGDVMPPKSTWFEPKPRSGLFVHPFED